MKEIKSLTDLKMLLLSDKRIHLYGAGVQASNFLSNLEQCEIEFSPIDILVTKNQGNREQVRGIPVVQCDKETLDAEDIILLTVSSAIRGEVLEYLRDCPAGLFDPMPAFYYDVYSQIASFAESFPEQVTGLNLPSNEAPERVVWTCWWQGEESAPDIVKACWKSQQRALSKEVKHIIITKENVSDYITIPEYVLEKFEFGQNLMAHLADFIRAGLLYKYGGMWLDSTVLLLEDIPEEYWELPICTWGVPGGHFNADAMWTTFFLGAQKGSVLYQFVMEAFLYYFKHYDRVKYYLMIDYFIAICTNEIPEVLKQFKQIPYNNGTALRLGAHLGEAYSEEKVREYCKGSFIQKLNWHKTDYGEGTIYDFIIKN